MQWLQADLWCLQGWKHLETISLCIGLYHALSMLVLRLEHCGTHISFTIPCLKGALGYSAKLLFALKWSRRRKGDVFLLEIMIMFIVLVFFWKKYSIILRVPYLDSFHSSNFGWSVSFSSPVFWSVVRFSCFGSCRNGWFSFSKLPFPGSRSFTFRE